MASNPVSTDPVPLQHWSPSLWEDIHLFFPFIQMAWGPWLAKSEERATLDLSIVGSSPTSGVEII